MYIILDTVIKLLLVLVPLLIGIAYLTLAERKVLGSMQLRRGPMTVGVYGLLQPLADGIKLFSKEAVIPTNANTGLYLFSPILGLILAFLGWAVIPFDEGSVLMDINLGQLYLFAISSISVYAILMSGWASNSKYAFYGAIRAAAQMISYEVSLGLIILTVIMFTGSINLTNIIYAQEGIWFFIPLFPGFIMFVISALAETSRAPFDLTEGESELVSGFNVEYSGMAFALFFLAEYSHILIMSTLITVLFFGGWLNPLSFIGLTFIPGFIWFAIKATLWAFIFIWVRASFPRMRYDQLMNLLWKNYLPISLGFLLFISAISAI